MKVVLDPNVIAIGLVPSGTTGAVLNAWLDDRSYELVVCSLLLQELEGVQRRPKFRSVPGETVDLLVARLRSEATVLDDPALDVGVTPDPDDDYLVALARQAGASLLVSGDPDLHGIGPHGFEVLSPRQFLERLGKA